MPVDRELLFRLATSSRFERVVRGLPHGERVAWTVASRYVAGTTREDAVRQARELAQQGVSSSIDQFGEDSDTADRVTTDYLQLAATLPTLPASVWLSIDLSHLGLDVDRIQVGAEDHDRTHPVLTCVLAAAERGLTERLGATVPANFHRSPDDLARLVAAGVHVRLVKGAYVEPPARALPYGEATDIAYLRLAQRLASTGAEFALATHDPVLREALLAALGPRPVEQLLGVRPEAFGDLVARGIPVRVYLPFGAGWFRYTMRRLAESRGA